MFYHYDDIECGTLSCIKIILKRVNNDLETTTLLDVDNENFIRRI